jgi:hypothetical protein
MVSWTMHMLLQKHYAELINVKKWEYLTITSLEKINYLQLQTTLLFSKSLSYRFQLLKNSELLIQ